VKEWPNARDSLYWDASGASKRFHMLQACTASAQVELPGIKLLSTLGHESPRGESSRQTDLPLESSSVISLPEKYCAQRPPYHLLYIHNLKSEK
jgi:hypothetical protein